jgi:hypothetical protein
MKAHPTSALMVLALALALPAAPQDNAGSAADGEKKNPFPGLERASAEANKAFNDQLVIFRDAVGKTCNPTRMKNENKKVQDLLNVREEKETRYLEARAERQDGVLQAMIPLQPQEAPPGADIDKVKDDKTAAEKRLEAAKAQQQKEPSPEIAQLVTTEQSYIARLQLTIETDAEEQTTRQRAVEDFKRALEIQQRYVDLEKAAITLLHTESRNWNAYFAAISSARLLKCANEEGTGLNRPKLGDPPRPRP